MTNSKLVSTCGTPAGMIAIAILGLAIAIIFAIACPKSAYSAPRGECTATMAKTVKKGSAPKARSTTAPKASKSKKMVGMLPPKAEVVIIAGEDVSMMAAGLVEAHVVPGSLRYRD
jgi:hypothetical protein